MKNRNKIYISVYSQDIFGTLATIFSCIRNTTLSSNHVAIISENKIVRILLRIIFIFFKNIHVVNGLGSLKNKKWWAGDDNGYSTYQLDIKSGTIFYPEWELKIIEMLQLAKKESGSNKMVLTLDLPKYKNTIFKKVTLSGSPSYNFIGPLKQVWTNLRVPTIMPMPIDLAANYGAIPVKDRKKKVLPVGIIAYDLFFTDKQSIVDNILAESNYDILVRTIELYKNGYGFAFTNADIHILKNVSYMQNNLLQDKRDILQKYLIDNSDVYLNYLEQIGINKFGRKILPNAIQDKYMGDTN